MYAAGRFAQNTGRTLSPVRLPLAGCRHGSDLVFTRGMISRFSKIAIALRSKLSVYKCRPGMPAAKIRLHMSVACWMPNACGDAGIVATMQAAEVLKQVLAYGRTALQRCTADHVIDLC